jgi:Tol biopolymer transport system component
VILDILRGAARRRACISTLALALGLFLVGCESGQIAAPQGTGVVWTRITDPQTAFQATCPAWRDHRIVFQCLRPVSASSARFRLAVVNDDGSNLVKLPIVATPYHDRSPRWVSDSTIIFSTGLDSVASDLWYRDIGVGGAEKILTQYVGGEWDPDPQPNGPGVVYTEGANQVKGRIVLLPDTAAVSPAITYLTPPEIVAGEPNWNPAGNGVCFSADSADGSRHIWFRSIVPDTAPIQLTTGPFQDYSPEFSPDGSKILFSSNRTGRSGLWTVSPLGEGVSLKVVAFEDPGAVLYTPAWSPDGTRIVVSSSGRSGGSLSLWVLSNLP